MSEDPFIAELEAAGYDSVRARVTWGSYKGDQLAKAEGWLKQKAQDRRNATPDAFLAVAASTKDAAWAAAESARVAASEASEANRLARAANADARAANRIAIAAIVIAAISAIIAALPHH